MKDIKIFACCHKEYDTIPPLTTLIQGGREINPPLEGIMGDNEGENISNKNREYCELTVMYYAWKNVEAGAYGFCHYRRFFCFDKTVTKRPYLAVGKMTEKKKKQYFLSEDETNKILSECDIAVTRAENMGMSVREHYENAPHHYKEDLDLFLEIIGEKAPFLLSYANEYLSSPNNYFCNMFIMDKKYFFEYASLLFSLLSELDKRKTMHNDFQSDRTNGYLGERFLGIYLLYAKANGARIEDFPRLDINCSFTKRLKYKLFPPESKIRKFLKRKKHTK